MDHVCVKNSHMHSHDFGMARANLPDGMFCSDWSLLMFQSGCVKLVLKELFEVERQGHLESRIEMLDTSYPVCLNYMTRAISLSLDEAKGRVFDVFSLSPSYSSPVSSGTHSAQVSVGGRYHLSESRYLPVGRLGKLRHGKRLWYLSREMLCRRNSAGRIGQS